MHRTPFHRPDSFAITATVEQLVLVASVYWALVANLAFFASALKYQSIADLSVLGFAIGLFVLLVALHFLLVYAFATRRTVKPLIGLLLVATAIVMYFMQAYGVYIDPAMLRSVLHTDATEAGELVSWKLLAHVALFALAPVVMLGNVRVVRRPWPRATAIRCAAMFGAAVVAVGALLAIYQPFASLMRNHKEVRYLITPANYLWSIAAVASKDLRSVRGPRVPIGLDAVPGPDMAARTRPFILVMVVGETARAANWGLSGYARQTTPELAQLPVINFPLVSSCGTNTEISLPCMFAPVGRRDYNEERIASSESLLHVVARAGVDVHWIDNQTGCKGVCDGLGYTTVAKLNPPGLCADGRCLDAGLLHGLDTRLRDANGTQILVLHQLGSHGPSYFRRYPPAFARFGPACRHDELGRCSREEIVNAYDNSILYSDHLLSRLIAMLDSASDRLDAALIYVSDHGESLGEGNFYLHGIPYAIAPTVQKRVPMVMWVSEGARRSLRLDAECLRHTAERPASHDHLFHTITGLLGVRTSLHAREWDLFHDCRAGSVRDG